MDHKVECKEAFLQLMIEHVQLFGGIGILLLISYTPHENNIWANYNDLSRGHPKW